MTQEQCDELVEYVSAMRDRPLETARKIAWRGLILEYVPTADVDDARAAIRGLMAEMPAERVTPDRIIAAVRAAPPAAGVRGAGVRAPASQPLLPGIAPTSVHPEAFTVRHSIPLVRTDAHERGRMNAQAMRQSEEAFLARKRATPSRIREMVGGLFQRAIDQRKRGGQRIAGAYCDWCDRDFGNLDELASYFEWVASIGGRSTDDRVFGNCCAREALVG